MDERLQSLNLATATAIDLAVKFGPKLVAAVLILTAGHFIARWSGRATGRALAKFDLERRCARSGVALATQGVLGNMVAGLTLIFSPPFRVGEHISIAKEEGEVLEKSASLTWSGWPSQASS